jgi:hypothetical protein
MVRYDLPRVTNCNVSPGFGTLYVDTFNIDTKKHTQNNELESRAAAPTT